MIWIFKVDEVFWNKPKVDEYYRFDTDDTNFNINQYDISLYFGTTDYFLLNELNCDEVYQLRYIGGDVNPIRMKIDSESEYHNLIRNFYTSQLREDKLNELGI